MEEPNIAVETVSAEEMLLYETAMREAEEMMNLHSTSATPIAPPTATPSTITSKTTAVHENDITEREGREEGNEGFTPNKRRKVDTQIDKPSPTVASPTGTSPIPCLPDYLVPNLQLVIVGDNPGIQSASKGRWYAHSSNHFWPLLQESGLIPHKLGPDEDYKLTQFGIGLTCLVPHKSTRSTAELSKEELKGGFELLKEKLLKVRPKLVVFNGKGIYEETVTGRICKLGLQPSPIRVEGVEFPCFVMPSTSARVRMHSKNDKLNFFKDVKAFIDKHK